MTASGGEPYSGGSSIKYAVTTPTTCASDEGGYPFIITVESLSQYVEIRENCSDTNRPVDSLQMNWIDETSFMYNGLLYQLIE